MTNLMQLRDNLRMRYSRIRVKCNSTGEKKNDMNKNEALWYINSKRSRVEYVDVIHLFSLTGTQLLPASQRVLAHCEG